jgi:small subunit ribosomal protein S27e
MKHVKRIVPKPRSRFLEVECKKCGETNIVFSKTATVLECKKCGEEIAAPTGGQAFIRGRVKKVLG